MTLIKSISGMRGTIGGVPGDDLTPIDIIGFTCAYGHLIKGDRDKCAWLSRS
jgi:phosphomannomutase